jgi:hypothetical protein
VFVWARLTSHNLAIVVVGGKARIFGPLTLSGISVVDSNFRPPSNARIAPVSLPVRYSFDFLASMNRGLTLPHLHVGSVLDFSPIRFRC